MSANKIFKYTCPHCNTVLDCDITLHNTIVNCPVCNNEIVPFLNINNDKISIAKKQKTNTKTVQEEINLALNKNNDKQIIINNIINNDLSNKPGQGQTNLVKSRAMYVILAILLGEFGIHNFYARI